MKEAGLKPTAMTFSAVLNVYARAGLGDRAVALADDLPLTALLENSVLNALLASGDHIAAAKRFERFEIRPDIHLAVSPTRNSPRHGGPKWPILKIYSNGHRFFSHFLGSSNTSIRSHL